MVIRGADGTLYWQDPDTGDLTEYTGQDKQPSTTTNGGGGTTTEAPGSQGSTEGKGGVSSGVSGIPAATGLVPQQVTDMETRLNANGQLTPWQLQGQDYATWSAQQAAARTDAQQKADLAIQLQQRSLANQGASTAQSGANAALSAQSAANNLAENKRQFDITNAQTQAQQATANATKQGDTLLGLGSRPDTLIKYLYALRGQQTPQAIGGTTTNLPGYQNVIGQPNPQPTTGPTGTTQTQGPETPPALGSVNRSLVPPGSVAPPAGTWQGVGTSNQTPQTISLSGPGANAPIIGGPTQYGGPGSGPAVTSSTPNPNPGQPFFTDAASSDAYVAAHPPSAQQQALQERNSDIGYRQSRGMNTEGFAKGGVIPEPVVGQGVDSGQTYTFGEKGPETVVPADENYAGDPADNKSPDIMDVVKTFMKHSSDKGHAAFGKGLAQAISDNGGGKPMGNRSYATGGTIGYDPTQVPSLGSQSSSFFNNPNLQNVVARGYNSSPSTPLFPQIGIATGGGQSLIPSAQRLSSLLPSEQSLYSGALQDEFGANAQDAFALSKSLAPGATNLKTPNYTSN